MNSLILMPEEISECGEVSIAGERMAYIRAWHGLKAGIRVKSGAFGGKMGFLEVNEYSETALKGRFTGVENPPAKVEILALIAVPRPQAFKRCLQAAVAFGIQKIFFVRSFHVVPSYMSSHSLWPENIKGELLKSMEQVCDTIPPEIKIFDSWKNFRAFLPEIRDEISGQKIVADTRAEKNIYTMKRQNSGAVAIGPEKGWTDGEIKEFLDNGFEAVSLGERILRVDHALMQMVISASAGL